MYRGIIHKARMRRLYNNKLTKVRLSVNDDKQSKDNEEKKEKEKPINFNNGDHLNHEFHFLLEEENRKSRNTNDLPPFLL